jgi:hypothetical protein
MEGMPTVASIENRRSGERVLANFIPLGVPVAQRIETEWNMHRWNQPDSGWDWIGLAQWASQHSLDLVGTALEAVGSIQGAVLFSVTAFSALEPGAGALHVERLAAAPWNRVLGTQMPIYSGCGQSLMQYVVLYSYRLGLKGRVNLSSLPSAQGFYRKLGFQGVGLVDSENLPIYEISTDAAIELLKNGRLHNG